jgi:hypothetical protein
MFLVSLSQYFSGVGSVTLESFHASSKREAAKILKEKGFKLSRDGTWSKRDDDDDGCKKVTVEPISHISSLR